MASLQPAELFFSDLLKSFMLYANLRGVKSFSLFGDKRWHLFFYEFKKTYSGKLHGLDCIGEFDWDGPFPKCRNVKNFNSVISLICVSDFITQKMFLSQEMLEHFKNSQERNLVLHENLLKAMYDFALGIEGFFQF